MKRQILILLVISLAFAFKFQQLRKADNCRFAKDFTTEQLLNDPAKLD